MEGCDRTKLQADSFFEKLHEKRAKFLAQFYYRLNNTLLNQKALFVIFDEDNPVVPKEDEFETISNNLDELEDNFLHYRLYISKSLAKLIQELIKQSKESVSNMLWNLRLGKVEEARKIFTEESVKQFESDGFKVQKKIEDEFRKILGVSS